MVQLFKEEQDSVFSGKAGYIIIIVGLLLVVTPFLLLAQYNHPSADDFCYTNFVGFHGFWEAQVEQYMNWSGRFTATALITLQPINTENLILYRLLPVLLFVLFIIAIYTFFRKLLPDAKQKDTFVLTFTVFFLYLLEAPELSEAFYWMAGSTTYQMGSIFTLFFFSVVIHLKDQKETNRKVLFTALAAFLCILIIGFNEILLIILDVILFLWLLIDTFKRKALDPYLLVLVLIAASASGISLLSPGNDVRMAVKPLKHKLDFSLSHSIDDAYYAIQGWVPKTGLLFLFFAAPLTRVAENLKSRLHLRRISLMHILLLAIFLFGFIFLCFFPTWWTQGGTPPLRTVNAIFLLYIFIVLPLGMAFLLYIKRFTVSRYIYSVPVQACSGLLILAIMILTTNNIRSAYIDLLTGNAYRYNLEMEERYDSLQNCRSASCVVPQIKNTPRTLMAYDLAYGSLDEGYYYNDCLSHYYDKASIEFSGSKQ